MVRRIEVDRNGRPSTVFHRAGREAWAHGFNEPCPRCPEDQLRQEQQLISELFHVSTDKEDVSSVPA